MHILSMGMLRAKGHSGHLYNMQGEMLAHRTEIQPKEPVSAVQVINAAGLLGIL